jgi:hypothetical protein
MPNATSRRMSFNTAMTKLNFGKAKVPPEYRLLAALANISPGPRPVNRYTMPSGILKERVTKHMRTTKAKSLAKTKREKKTVLSRNV